MLYESKFKVFLSEEELRQTVKELGKQITEDYKDKNLLVISVLKGSFLFTADLIREIKCDMVTDFMSVSSYSGTERTDKLVFKKDIDTNPEGMDILIVEDILDSGVTLSYLKEVLRDRKASSIKICTLLDKPSNRKVDINPDYTGRVIPDKFVIGYGFDYCEKYRNLPYIAVVED